MERVQRLWDSHKAGEKKRQLERDGWGDVSEQMQQQREWWPRAGQTVFRSAQHTARGRMAGGWPPGPLGSLCGSPACPLLRCRAQAGPQPARCSPHQHPSRSQTGSGAPTRSCHPHPPTQNTVTSWLPSRGLAVWCSDRRRIRSDLT